jgi:Uma2 family endonuclease
MSTPASLPALATFADMPVVKTGATYADLEALPDNVVGELVDGELHASPRPASPHATATSELLGSIIGPFGRGIGGSGGWIILVEPELHLGRAVLVPDLAGWRRERMPVMPEVVGFELPPDWLCEVLSPSTARLDRRSKLPLYAKARVAHVWLVDPILQTLEVFALDGATYRLLLVASTDEVGRYAPFDAIELELALLWRR